VAVLATWSTMYIITIVVVGVIAGVLASVVMRGSSVGVYRYVLFGIVGAFIAGWAFGELGWHAPFSGIAGVTAVACVGAAGALAFSWLWTRPARTRR